MFSASYTSFFHVWFIYLTSKYFNNTFLLERMFLMLLLTSELRGMDA